MGIKGLLKLLDNVMGECAMLIYVAHHYNSA